MESQLTLSCTYRCEMWRAALTVRVATARANTARVGCRAMMGLPGPNVLEQARVPCERRQTAGVPLTAAWPTHGAKRWLINLQEDTVTDPVEGPAENERSVPSFHILSLHSARSAPNTKQADRRLRRGTLMRTG